MVKLSVVYWHLVGRCIEKWNHWKEKIKFLIDYPHAFVLLLWIFVLSKKISMDQQLMIAIVAFSILSFQPVEYDTPTDVFTVRTSGQGKHVIFLFQLRTIFSGSEPIYFWSKCSKQFKIRCMSRSRTRSMLAEKGHVRSKLVGILNQNARLNISSGCLKNVFFSVMFLHFQEYFKVSFTYCMWNCTWPLHLFCESFTK